MRKKVINVKYIEPFATSTITKAERKELIDTGLWRVFKVDGVEFIVPIQRPHKPPRTIHGTHPLLLGLSMGGLPRPTYSYESKGKYKGHKIDLVAWPYKTMTIQEFDAYKQREDIRHVAPKSLTNFKNAFAYVWTDNGLHVYQRGKQPIDENSDHEFERISRENRGWYGDRVRSKDYTQARTLVTTDEQAAQVWALAGGKVRLVKDIEKSYIASRGMRDRQRR